MLDWDDYRIFLTVARTPSVRAAANELAISHSTVLRRLDRLEQKLGSRLFERQSVGYRLTEAGEGVMQGALEIEESVQGIDRAVTGQDSALEGKVKITMPHIMAHPRFFPDLKQFQRQFPNIQLEVELSLSVSNLSKREADIAIRVTNEPSDDLIGRKLGPAMMAMYAEENYVKKYQPHKKDSKAKIIAHKDSEFWGEKAKFSNMVSEFAHLGEVGFFDNSMMQLMLVKEGVGISLLPTLIGDSEPGLVRISEPLYESDVWILYHKDLRKTSRVRAVRDFLQQSILDKIHQGKEIPNV